MDTRKSKAKAKAKAPSKAKAKAPRKLAPKIAPAWTPERIRGLLLANDRAVERAMIALWFYSPSPHGFSSFHAGAGNYYADWCLKDRHLDGRHLSAARRISLQYIEQLADIANGKAVAGKEGA